MATRWILSLGVLASVGCTTVSLSRLDRCVVQKTDHAFGDTREEILFCDPEQPQWSTDRSVRLAQECLYNDTLSRRDQLLLAHKSGELPKDGFKSAEVFSQCYPDAVGAVQAENELLKDRSERTDDARRRAEQQHAKLEEGLTKALDRPINAVADAKATSDSGSDVKSRSDFAHSDIETKREQQLVQVPERPKPAIKKAADTPPPQKKNVACEMPCPAPSPAPNPPAP